MWQVLLIQGADVLPWRRQGASRLRPSPRQRLSEVLAWQGNDPPMAILSVAGVLRSGTAIQRILGMRGIAILSRLTA